MAKESLLACRLLLNNLSPASPPIELTNDCRGSLLPTWLHSGPATLFSYFPRWTQGWRLTIATHFHLMERRPTDNGAVCVRVRGLLCAGTYCNCRFQMAVSASHPKPGSRGWTADVCNRNSPGHGLEPLKARVC